MNDFLRDVIKNAGNEYAAIVDDGVEAGDVDSFIDTGSYIFNGLLSGSIYGGLPSNKITAIAGESATGGGGEEHRTEPVWIGFHAHPGRRCRNVEGADDARSVRL